LIVSSYVRQRTVISHLLNVSEYFDMRVPSIRNVGTTQVQQERFYAAGGVDDGTTLTPSALLEVHQCCDEPQ
jgi:hypothetical protein